MSSHSTLVVRPVRHGDEESLRELLIGFTAYSAEVPEAEFVERLTARIDDPAWCLLLAEDSERVLGYAIAQDFGPNLRCRFTTGRVDDCYVVPQARHRGVGRALMQAVFEWARSRPEPMVLDWQSTPSAVRFYESMGFSADREGDYAEYPGFCLDLRDRALPGHASPLASSGTSTAYSTSTDNST